jgi:N-methylhydantoinase A
LRQRVLFRREFGAAGVSVMRVSADVGGTFTDLVVETAPGQFRLFKTPTTLEDPAIGVFDAFRLAARSCDSSLEKFLTGVDMLVHATTLATNLILTNSAARTAFLTTAGHPDILLFREGGRREPFNNKVPFPMPYVPRSLTFEVPERVDSVGNVVLALDEDVVRDIIARLRERKVDAVGVCFLWSMLAPAHELRVGELLEKHLPDVPYTLSHRLNPTIREYRRASSTCIDASLKPLMSRYLASLRERLTAAGFRGQLLIVSSLGSVVDASYLAGHPIHSVKSGPAVAPIAGRHYAKVVSGSDVAIVADAGGTSYDVALVNRGLIPVTRETWLGEPLRGHMTGFPSVDVRSIGAGGGSIAWVDEGRMLRIGPQSAGSTPGPACYGKGGQQPTVTDAALALGYLDPEYFLGGAIVLNAAAARDAIEHRVARSLGLNVPGAAAAILELATEYMIHAIEEITINQGIDPAGAVLIGGGGAAGLNSGRIARRLGCSQVIIPPVGATLSAAGALMSDLSTEFSATCLTTSRDFDFAAVNETLAALEEQCNAFVADLTVAFARRDILFFAEARYPHQIWEVEVPLCGPRLLSDADVQRLVEMLHANHERLFSFRDRESEVEIVTWRARVVCSLPQVGNIDVPQHGTRAPGERRRRAIFPGLGEVDTPVRDFHAMTAAPVAGPLLVDADFTTIVVDPGALAVRTPDGSLAIRLE